MIDEKRSENNGSQRIRIFFTLFVFILTSAAGVLLLRSAHSLKMGESLELQGRSLEASRAYETAIQAYVPFSPFTRTAAVRMITLADSAGEKSPKVSVEIRNRMRRALFSIRSFYQPCADLLEGQKIPPPRDPSLPLVLLSIFALGIGLTGWAYPLKRYLAWSLTAAGFLAGILLLTLT